MAKILIIDDDTGFRHMVNAALVRSGHRVTEAGDGNEGVRLFKSELPDLVICDIVMPDKDGIETILEIRAVSPVTPVIAMSGGGVNLGLEYLDMAQKLGAHSVLSKPFRLPELLALVERCLKGGDEQETDPA
jgi:DNA-binding response OmpR family regulator